MPTQKFPIERNGPKRIEVTWSGMWKNFTVKFDGADVGNATKEEINAGKEFTLSDGSTFKVHLRRVGMSTELALLRNGVPLPGSGADPVQLVKTAAGIVYFLGGLQALLGLIAVVGRVEALEAAGLGVESLVIGVVLGVLGFFTMQRSKLALALAMVVFAGGGVLAMVAAVDASGTPPVGGIIVRVLFLTAMWRGYKAIGELKAQQQQQAPSITSG
jgi:hypothetical protein